MNAKLHFRSQVNLCTDANNGRYALANVEIRNANGECPLAIATDGRALAVAHVDVDGDCPDVFHIPGAALKGRFPKSGVSLSANGRVENHATSKIVDAADEDATYPRIKGVAGQPQSQPIAISFDAQLLLNLAKAIGDPAGDHPTAVTLFIDGDAVCASRGRQTLANELPIRVVAHSGGAGILMPMTADGVDGQKDRMEYLYRQAGIDD